MYAPQETVSNGLGGVGRCTAGAESLDGRTYHSVSEKRARMMHSSGVQGRCLLGESRSGSDSGEQVELDGRWIFAFAWQTVQSGLGTGTCAERIPDGLCFEF
jgi:hypothetical protein